MTNGPDKNNHALDEAEKEKRFNLNNASLYPVSEDIYNTSLQEADLDPEDTTKMKVENEIDADTGLNEKSFKDDVSGSDLDVPGSELDDALENIEVKMKKIICTV